MESKFYKYFLPLIIFAGIFLSGCGREPIDSPQHKVLIIDSIGRQVSIDRDIRRAVVTHRYNMEAVQSIGALEQVVGVGYWVYQDQAAYGTKFKLEQVVGKSERELNYEAIIRMNPQVVILAGNGAWQEAEKKLAPFNIPVVVMNAYYTAEFERTYSLAGEVFGRQEQAREIIGFFREKLEYINQALNNVPKKTVYFEYKNPGWTTIPGDYYFEMIEYAHGENIFKQAKGTQIDIEAVAVKNPAVIIKVGEQLVDPQYLPPDEREWLARKERLINRPGWGNIDAVVNNQIFLISQYAQGGVNKLVGTMYVAKFLYPEHLPDLHPEEIFHTWVTKYQKMPYITGHTYPAMGFKD